MNTDWATATDDEIIHSINNALMEMRRQNPQETFTTDWILPPHVYRALAFTKRTVKVRKGPGKGRNTTVMVKRK